MAIYEFQTESGRTIYARAVDEGIADAKYIAWSKADADADGEDTYLSDVHTEEDWAEMWKGPEVL
jgi:hypothetical protein